MKKTLLALTLAAALSSCGPLPSSPDGGALSCAALTCGSNSHCQEGKGCVCDDGFFESSAGCARGVDPRPGLGKEEACALWKSGHVVTTPAPFTASSTACAPGTLAQGGIDDTLTRVNMFRSFVGLAPTTASPGLNGPAQKCAVIAAWNPAGLQAHTPPPSSQCYTAEGASSAGQSNIAWGSGSPAQSVDSFMEDAGNDSTMGHRRWILNPPLDPIGVGYYEGGDSGFGNTECLQVFSTKGTGPRPAWYAFPQGVVPLEISRWTWTFHGSVAATVNAANATATVVRKSDGASLPVTMRPLAQGYGDSATSFVPKGWVPAADTTYVVTITGAGPNPRTYEVTPVTCL